MGEARQPALVFDSVMKECGNGLVFIAAVLDDDRGDSEQVADVRAVFALARLMRVEPRGIAKRSDESARKLRAARNGFW